ncbi:MAG: hypothetical protein Q9209_003852 [Squamulea sp. 1 TL-2023]
MASVAAMRRLAYLDINSFIGNTKTWSHPEYPGVSVTMRGEEGRGSSVRFAMWLIQASIKDIMFLERYQTAVFSGWYRGIRVGRITFSATGHANVEGTSRIATPSVKNNISSISFDLNISSTGRSPVSTDHLDARVQYVDKAMDRRDAFFTMIWLLMAFASRYNEPLGAYSCSVPAVTAEVRTIWNAVLRPPRPPYLLKAGDMVNMIAQLAVVLTRDQVYQEMNVIISDEGVEIARGDLHALLSTFQSFVPAQMANQNVLSSEQAHALFDILTSHITLTEIENLKYSKTIATFGPPLQSSNVKEASTPLLRILLQSFITDLPGFRNVTPRFWTDTIYPLAIALDEANLSESYDKGSVGIRRTLSTATASIVESVARGRLGGYPKQTLNTDSDYDKADPDQLAKGWDDFLQRIIYGDLLDKMFIKAAETDKLTDHEPVVQAAHQYALTM